MFKVFDYLTGNTFSFDDQQALVDWWKKTNGKLNFSELNVTGCDYHGPSLDAYVNPETQEWNFAPNKEIKPQIKRFVVIDNNCRTLGPQTKKNTPMGALSLAVLRQQAALAQDQRHELQSQGPQKLYQNRGRPAACRH